MVIQEHFFAKKFNTERSSLQENNNPHSTHV